MDALVAHVSGVLLLPPLANAAEHGPPREQARVLEKLRAIAGPAHKKKPKMVCRVLLPAMYRMLSEAKSGTKSGTLAGVEALLRELGAQMGASELLAHARRDTAGRQKLGAVMALISPPI